MPATLRNTQQFSAWFCARRYLVHDLVAKRVRLTRAFGPRPPGAVAEPPASKNAPHFCQTHGLGLLPCPRSTFIWRKGWDSNPRKGCPFASFQDWSLKPLGHLSSIDRVHILHDARFLEKEFAVPYAALRISLQEIRAQGDRSWDLAALS
jgi:hypothetical protein